MTQQFTHTIVTDDVLLDMPYRYGRQDGLQASGCVPEMYFGSNDAILHYTLGYESATGETPTTRQLKGTYAQPSIHQDLTEVKWERNYKSYGWFTVPEETVRKAIELMGEPMEPSLEEMRQGRVRHFLLYQFRAYREQEVSVEA